MNFESIIANIDSLPPLSNAAFLVQQLYSRDADNVNIAKLVRIIESDALLTANILKMINAPVHGFSKKIASISHAVTLFGTRNIYGLVINYAINEKIKANTAIYGLSAPEFNQMCHLQSTLMMQWFSKIDLRHAQLLAPLALIMESGKLVLSNEVAKSNYVQEFKKGFRDCDDIERYEYSLIDTTSYYLSALLFEHWHLEPLYIEILKGLDFETDADKKLEFYMDTLDVIRVAINVKHILTDESILLACNVVEDLGLDPKHFKNTAIRVRDTHLKDENKR